MDIKATAITGAKWTTLSAIITAGVQILRFAILARFLEKADFGVVAIVMFVFGLVESFSDLGFSSAIMHKKDLTTNQFSSLYWIQMILFVLIAVTISFFSPLIARFYEEDSLTVLLPITLLGLFSLGIGKLYETILQKNVEFKVLAVRNIITSLLSLIFAVILVYFGAGVYSLILSTLLQLLIVNLWNFIVGQKTYKLRFYLSFYEVKPLVKIGLYQTGTQFIDYLSSRLDILIIGKLLGTETLGVYNLAKEILLKAMTMINGIANKVALPIFAFIQEDLEMMRENYCKLIKIITYISIPIFVLIGSVSIPLVDILYGVDYADVAPIMMIFSISFIFVCIGNPVGNVVTAEGRTDISFYYTIIRLLYSLVIVYFTAKNGIITTSWGQVFLAIFGLLVTWYMELWFIIKLTLKRYLKSFGLNAAVSLALILVGYYMVSGNILNITQPFGQLIVYGTIIMFTYFLVIFFLFRNDLVTLKRYIIKRKQ